MRRLAVAGIVVAAVLGGAQPAMAAAQWLPSAQAFNDTDAIYVAGTMASDGTIAVARITATYDLEVRVRPPGGDFGPPVTVSRFAGSPQLVAGPNGHIALLWRSDYIEWVAIRPPGGSFSHPRGIGDESAPGQGDIAVDGRGRVWFLRPYYDSVGVSTMDSHGVGNGFELGTGGAWRTTGASLDADATGRVTIIYGQTRPELGENEFDHCEIHDEIRVAEGDATGIADVAVLARTTQTGSTFEGGCSAMGGASAGGYSVAVRADGEALATYALATPGWAGEVDTQLVARLRPADGAWPATASAPELVDTGRFRPSGIPTYAGTTPIVAIADGDTGAIRLSARTSDGSWSSPTFVTSNGASSPLLAGSASGSATISYVETSLAGSRRVMAAVRQPGGGISVPVPLSNTAEFFTHPDGLGMDDEGNALVAWLENHGSQTRARFAGYDGAGPRLSASFPAGGTIGQMLPFSATALDVWSGPVTFDWSFGDGTGAGGQVATHAYGATGPFAASVIARDGLGNASVRSTTISISEPTDTTRPAFRGSPSVSPSRVRRGIPATIRFDVSEAATVQATLTTRRRGVRSGRRCVAPRRRSARRGARRCKRAVVLPSRWTTLDAAGPGGIVLPTKRLKPGRYSIALVATDPAGNRSSTVMLKLTVLPRARR